MAISAQQVSREIIDWYNSADDITEDEKVTSLTEYVWNEFYETLNEEKNVEKWGTPRLASGLAYQVEDHGGGEGDGEERYVVFQIGDQFFKVEGYYASWDGSNWDDPEPFEVAPVEKTITVYERISG